MAVGARHAVPQSRSRSWTLWRLTVEEADMKAMHGAAQSYSAYISETWYDPPTATLKLHAHGEQSTNPTKTSVSATLSEWVVSQAPTLSTNLSAFLDSFCKAHRDEGRRDTSEPIEKHLTRYIFGICRPTPKFVLSMNR